jgi:hypothetical protein
MFRSILIVALLVPTAAFAQAKGQQAYQPYTIGLSPTVVVNQNIAGVILDFVNVSTTATIACAPSYTTPTINGAGSYTIPPGWHRSWEGSFVPTDQWACIASAANTPMTVGVR